MREMRSRSEIMSSATEFSVSFREASMASSFSACGTVRGKPSSTNLSHPGRREERGNIFFQEKEHVKDGRLLTRSCMSCCSQVGLGLCPP
jgi:hypothetical protein